MCMKNTPGRPCDSCGGCVPCAVNRIDVTVGVPEPGQPGAALGSFGWNVTTQPTAEKVVANVLGTNREVCRQIYQAPSTTVCVGGNALSYNAEFMTLERSILYDYWQANVVGGVGDYRWYIGNMVWRCYAYIQNVSVTVLRWNGLARTILSGVISQGAERQSAIGGRLRIYDVAGCGLMQDLTSTQNVRWVCARGAECNAGVLGVNFYNIFDSMYKASVFPIQRDSGWVAGSCSALPTNDAGGPSICAAAYNPTAAAGPCRIPFDSTFVDLGPSLGCTQGGANLFYHRYNFRTEDVWFSRNPLSFS